MTLQQKVALTLILFLAFALRFFQLGKAPPSLDWDEVSIGYNAYSLLKTAHDEYGNFLPLSIRSLEDYKPPLYTYLTTFSIFLFGLSEQAVRLPSAIFGFLTVVAVFFLMRELWPQSLNLTLLTTFLLTISPWHLQFSRVAFEANLGLFWVVLAVLFFLKGQRKPFFFFPASFFFACAIYSYHSQRIFVPFLGLGLIFLYWKKLRRFKKPVVLAVVLFFILLLPLLPQVFSSGGIARFTASSPFTKVNFLENSIKEIEHDNQRGDPFGRVIHNRRLVYLQSILLGYFSHFDLNFFIRGDGNLRHFVPQVGHIYLWEIPFLLLGVYFLIKQREKNRPLIFLWAALAPVAASPVIPTPHAVRALTFLPITIIITAYGLWSINRVLIYPFSHLFKGAIALLAFLFITFYIHQYYGHYVFDYASDWQFGYKETVLLSKQYENEVKQVFVSSKMEEAYVFFLFYQAIDPSSYQRSGSNRHAFFKYYFLKPTERYNFNEVKEALFIGPPKEIPDNFVLREEILDKKGNPLLAIAQTGRLEGK